MCLSVVENEQLSEEDTGSHVVPEVYTRAHVRTHIQQHRDALWFREPRVLPPAFHMIGKLSHRGEPGMWRGASTTMAERSHGPSIMRLFYTVAIWVTIIHRTKGIPWTQEKVGPNKLCFFFHICWSLPFKMCIGTKKKQSLKVTQTCHMQF